MQEDLDCYLLACYRGKLAVVQELVNRHKMNPHIANEVRACVCVCVLCMCVCMHACMHSERLAFVRVVDLLVLHTRTDHLLQLLFNVFPKEGWTGVLAAARYGFADVVRELITKFGCDRNAVKEVSCTWAYGP